ncbi:MAG: hypothetical protein ACE369_01105 [Roseovarius sp.]
MDVLISLIAGAMGGNIAGGLLGRYSLGFVINSSLGVLGGWLGARFLDGAGLGGLAQTASDSAALDPVALAAQLVAGAVSGGLCICAIGTLRRVATR